MTGNFLNDIKREVNITYKLYSYQCHRVTCEDLEMIQQSLNLLLVCILFFVFLGIEKSLVTADDDFDENLDLYPDGM